MRTSPCAGINKGTWAGLAGPRVLEKGRAEVASSSSSSSGSDTDCDAACDEEADGAGGRRQNRRAHAACSTASYSNASCDVKGLNSGSLALCSLLYPSSTRAHWSI